MLPLPQTILNANRWINCEGNVYARAGQLYILNNTLTIFLPSVAKVGDSIDLILPASASTLTITINPQGLNLFGLTTSYLWYSSSVNCQKDTLIYVSRSFGWVFNSQLITNQINTFGTLTTLSYVGINDNNDLFYVLGSNGRRATWSNIGGNAIDYVASSSNPSYSDISISTGISFGTYVTSAGGTPWVVFDIGKNKISRKIRLASFVTFTRSIGDSALRNFSIQGTNAISTFDVTGVNAATWSTIKTYTNDTRMSTVANTLAIYSFTTDESLSFFRYLRILCNGYASNGWAEISLNRVLLYGDVINL